MEQIEIKSFWEKGSERGGHWDMYRVNWSCSFGFMPLFHYDFM